MIYVFTSRLAFAEDKFGAQANTGIGEFSKEKDQRWSLMQL